LPFGPTGQAGPVKPDHHGPVDPVGQTRPPRPGRPGRSNRPVPPTPPLTRALLRPRGCRLRFRPTPAIAGCRPGHIQHRCWRYSAVLSSLDSRRRSSSLFTRPRPRRNPNLGFDSSPMRLPSGCASGCYLSMTNPTNSSSPTTSTTTSITLHRRLLSDDSAVPPRRLRQPPIAIAHGRGLLHRGAVVGCGCPSPTSTLTSPPLAMPPI
jgi:hypothetical protein